MSITKTLLDVLKDKINKIGKTYLHQNTQNFQQKEDIYMNCEYLNPSAKDDTNTLTGKQNLFFDIKITDYLWKNEKALIVLFQDISQKVFEDRDNKINAFKKKMIANVSHNMKTPLNGIVLLAQSLLNTPQSNLGQEIISDILLNSELLLNIVNDILEYAEFSRRKHALSITKFELRKPLNEIITLYQKQAHLKCLGLECTFQGVHEIEIIENDYTRLKQILLDLVGNAIKYTTRGFIKIEVQQSPENENCLEISVVDSGIGMSEKKRKAVLQMFDNTRDIGSRHSRTEGTSMALAPSFELSSLLSPVSCALRSAISLLRHLNFFFFKFCCCRCFKHFCA